MADARVAPAVTTFAAHSAKPVEVVVQRAVVLGAVAEQEPVQAQIEA